EVPGELPPVWVVRLRKRRTDNPACRPTRRWNFEHIFLAGLATGSKGSIIALFLQLHGSRLVSSLVSEPACRTVAPRGGFYGTHEPGPSHLGWFVSWSSNQHRRIHHKWGGPERRVGPGDAGAGQIGRAQHGGDRDVQYLGVPAGHRCCLALRGHPPALWCRTEYRSSRGTGRLGSCRVSP